MNSYERIRAALEGKSVDHTPFSPFLAYVWEFFPESVRTAGPLAFHNMIGADPLWRGAPCPVKAITPDYEIKKYQDGDLSVEDHITPVGSIRYASMQSEAGGTNFLVEHPLKQEEDYKVQLWIEENTHYEYNQEAVARHFEGDGAEGLSLGMLIPRGKSSFQHLIETLVGTEELMYALMDFPDTVENLWRTMVKNNLAVVELAVQSDYEYFITWEDSSTQNYSPSQYEKYIAPEINSWCDILAGHGKKYIQHACGHVKDLLIPMKRSGVHGVESLSSPPTGNIELKEARRIAGQDLAIIGGIEPVKFLQYDMSQLTDYTEQILREGAGGPFVLANSDSCPPGVTIEKFKLVADVAKKTKMG